MLDNHNLVCLHGSNHTQCYKCSKGYVNNIGKIDKLGCFKLDPVIEMTIKGHEDENLWDKLRNEVKLKSEREAYLNSCKIMTEVMQEVLEHTPESSIPKSFIEFLSEGIN